VDWAAWPGVLAEHDAEHEAGTQPLTERMRAWAEEYAANVHPEPLAWRPDLSLAPADAPGLVAAERDDLPDSGGWDYLDLQQADALQEMQEMQEAQRRRLNACRGGEEGRHE
jgi:hypothetical protein